MKKMTLIATLLLTLATHAYAQPSAPDHAAHHPAQAQTAPGSTMTDGEIRRIDKDAKKLTIRHGPIKNLDMPPMTMVFQVKDPAMLDKVNTGDKIKFSAERIDGAYTVTHIEPGT